MGFVMSDPVIESARSVIRKRIEKQSEEYENLKKNNKEIKNLLISSLDELISHYQNIQDSKNHADDIKEKYKKQIESNQSNINQILVYSEQLKSLIVSIDDNEYNDLTFLKPLDFTFETVKLPYNYKDISSFNQDVLEVISKLSASINFFSKYKEQKNIYEAIFTNEINNMFEEAKAELYDFKEYKNILKNIKAHDFYEQERDSFRCKSRFYKIMFLGTLTSAITIAMVSVLAEPRFILDKFDYWFLKISSILVSITIITYFLKQSIHYQKFADQANQTGLEIKAFPSFIAGANKETESEIRKQLALKYFGREIDGTAHKDMSNLISDQMKSTTDMVKATTEAIKNLK